ncbi:hypothetical protein MBLNU457_4943t1 [Dothideomycetes sp. NU457]
MVKGRKKRQAEELAQKIFRPKNNDRRQSAPSAANRTASPALSASLASRMGVNKRSTSTASLNNKPGSLASRIGNNSPQQGRLNRKAEKNAQRIANAAARAQGQIAQSQNGFAARSGGMNVAGAGAEAEISIRGAAGPYTVIAQNFAPGTTAADIESVMQPIGGDMGGCRLLASNPTVIAEMIFLDRAGAENVIATFNNKKADGRLLYVYMTTTTAPARAPIVARDEVYQPAFPAAPIVEQTPIVEQDAMMGIEVDVQGDPGLKEDIPIYEAPRSSRDDRREDGRDDRRDDRRDDKRDVRRDDRDYRDDYSRRPERDQRRADPSYQDGRYGFGDARGPPRYGGRNDRRGGGGRGGGGYGGGRGGMYSDNMGQYGGGRYR